MKTAHSLTLTEVENDSIICSDGTEVPFTHIFEHTVCIEDQSGLNFFNWSTGKMDIHTTGVEVEKYELETNFFENEGDLLAVPIENEEYNIYDVFSGDLIWSETAFSVKGSGRYVYIYDANIGKYTVYRIDRK